MTAQGDKEKIVIVDDSLTNLKTAKVALGNKYAVFTMPSGDKLFSFLESVLPDLIILDIGMPGMDGYEVCARLKENDRTNDIPVIFLTAHSSGGDELHGLTLGAVDYITKPFAPEIFRQRIELHLLLLSQKRQLEQYSQHLQQLVEEKTETVIELHKTIFDVLAEVVAYRDDITGKHVYQVKKIMEVFFRVLRQSAVYADEIANWDGELFAMSSILHDVGKIAISDEILTNPGNLEGSQLAEMRRHTIVGGKLLERIEANTKDNEFIRHAKLMAQTHHEHWDGSGYPLGLAGEKIPLEGRLMAIVDVFEALISERSYKESFNIDEAADMIRQRSGTDFDPKLVAVFLEALGEIRKTVERS